MQKREPVPDLTLDKIAHFHFFTHEYLTVTMFLISVFKLIVCSFASQFQNEDFEAILHASITLSA
jgi:hypothetical protein